MMFDFVVGSAILGHMPGHSHPPDVSELQQLQEGEREGDSLV